MPPINRIRLLLLSLSTLLVAACGETRAPPTVVAHRAGSGYWPENSRTAVLESIQRRYPGIEVDLTLTRDGVPVLAHEPWLNETFCTTVDGAPLTSRVFIQDLMLDQLREGYRCGGVVNPDAPEAKVVADTVMTLDELLDALAAAPEMLVHLDLKCEPELTPPPEAFAEQIMKRWRARGLPNPMYVDSGRPEVLKAFRAQGPVTTTLSWPLLPTESSAVPTVLLHELLTRTGVDDMVAAALRAGSDGVVIPYQLADRHLVERAHREGLKVQLFSPNSRELLESYCDWPVDVVITDFPEEAPCLR
jgi:glycerophosphoryl diester phosphodiesterase